MEVNVQFFQVQMAVGGGQSGMTSGVSPHFDVNLHAWQDEK